MGLRRAGCCVAVLITLSACSPDLSPNTYNSTAVQQANKVEQGVIVGVRQVSVKVAGTNGAIAGAAAGGVVGSQLPGSETTSALGVVGGSLIGGLIGSSAERAAGDTQAYEYIVRKPNNDLISVTQVDPTPLIVGQHVLVIAGSQARIVPDYIVPPPPAPAKAEPAKPAPAAPAAPAAPVAAPADAAAPVAAPAEAPADTAKPAAAAVDPIIPVIEPLKSAATVIETGRGSAARSLSAVTIPLTTTPAETPTQP